MGRAVYGARGAAVTVVRLPRMDPERRARAPRRAGGAVRRGPARAAADRLQVLGRLRGGAARRERSGQGRHEGVGRPVELRGRGRGPRAPARVRRHPRLRRPARAAPRSTPTRAGCGTTCSRGSRSSTDDRVLRRLRPAPDRRDRARGQRGHRQDVHDRRAGRPLRRRGHPAGADPDGDVHAHGHRRAARARPRAAGQRRAGARARAGGRAAAGRRGRGAARHRRAGRWSRVRRERLAAALADFDSATIATTHGFCQEVLGGLGVLGDIESDTTFVEDISDLRDEVVDDLYLRRFHSRGVPEFSRAQAMAIASAAIDNPAAPLEPADAPDDTIEAMRVRLAGAARKELEARKRRMGVMTYDDLLTRLSDTLEGEGGAVAAARLRDRYRVVLVDEFQDTDPVQWRIMQTAFGDGETTLVLIGDPKQAIYAFRGADVYAYIEAARTAGAEATLTTNWRSDQGLIDAYDALFGGAKLGHEGIVYREVRAANRGRAPARRAGPGAAADPRRPAQRGRPDRQGLRAARARAPARRLRRRGRHRGAAALGRRDRRRGPRPPRPHRRARADEPQRVARPRRAGGGRRPRRHQRRRQRVRHRAGPRVAARARGDRAPLLPAARPLGRADHDPRLDDRAGRGRRRRRLGGRAPAPAPLGARAAREGRRVADGGDHAGGGPARARAGDGRRRAADDRPAPRRRAAPRRGDGRADGRHRADGLAARSACSRRRATTTTRSAAAGSRATPRRSRC